MDRIPLHQALVGLLLTVAAVIIALRLTREASSRVRWPRAGPAGTSAVWVRRDAIRQPTSGGAGVRADPERLTGMLAPAKLRGGIVAFLADRTFAVITARDAAESP